MQELRQPWTQPSKDAGRQLLPGLDQASSKYRIKQLRHMANTLSIHRNGVLAYYDAPISTGLLEGTNHQDPAPQTPGLRVPRPRLLSTSVSTLSTKLASRSSDERQGRKRLKGRF